MRTESEIITTAATITGVDPGELILLQPEEILAVGDLLIAGEGRDVVNTWAGKTVAYALEQYEGVVRHDPSAKVAGRPELPTIVRLLATHVKSGNDIGSGADAAWDAFRTNKWNAGNHSMVIVAALNLAPLPNGIATNEEATALIEIANTIMARMDKAKTNRFGTKVVAALQKKGII